MMMKKTMTLTGLVMMGFLLAGCNDPELLYKGDRMPASEVEERIADELEVENPDHDLEVDIYTEDDE